MVYLADLFSLRGTSPGLLEKNRRAYLSNTRGKEKEGKGAISQKNIAKFAEKAEGTRTARVENKKEKNICAGQEERLKEGGVRKKPKGKIKITKKAHKGARQRPALWAMAAPCLLLPSRRLVVHTLA